MEGFEGSFTLVGGINLPKIIACRGSDGVVRRQLVKGKDDLRQVTTLTLHRAGSFDRTDLNKGPINGSN